MKSLSILYARLLRLGETPRHARNLCDAAEAMLHGDGRFLLPVSGGWVFGELTNHGVWLGNPPRRVAIERMGAMEA